MQQVLATLAHTADGAFAVDRRQRIVFWNAAAERLLGYTASEVCGRPCHEIVQGQPRPGCLLCGPHCPVQRAVAQGELPPAYNVLTQTKDGRTVLLNVSVIVPPPQSGALASIHLFRDVTPQLQYEAFVEQILREAERLPLPRTPLLGARRPLGVALTPREKAVLYLLVEGKAPREMAAALGLRYATVRNYLQNVLRKLGVHSQRQAVKLALEQGLV
ncbi:MAG: hypothetical protein KatS3mg131_3575 [Candidatus Tectimicrobiota bacterium]|nr:MAG: hypothetical protein KatS3mg131_3575 [Candidatus Tectomicrobia bacterium]